MTIIDSFNPIIVGLLYDRATDGRLAGLMTICFIQANNVCYRWTDGPEGAVLLMNRWTRGCCSTDEPMDQRVLFYWWTDGPSWSEGPLLLSNRWADGP